MAAIFVGCSVSEKTYDAPVGSDASVPPIPPPSVPPDGAAQDRLAVSTSVRFAHLAGTVGALDFCYRRSGTDQIVGPLIGAPDAGPPPSDAAVDGADADDATSSDAASPSIGGLAAFKVTGYWPIDGAGNYRIDAVAAGSTSCNAPIASSEVTLEAGRYATVVVMGRAPLAIVDAGAEAGVADAASIDAGVDGAIDAGTRALAIAAFGDDLVVEPGKARVRFVHAALGDDTRDPAGPLSIAVIDGTRSTTLVPRVEPWRTATTTTGIDARGYGAYAPFADPQGLRFDEIADAGGRTWSSAQSSLGLGVGSIHSGFVVTRDTGLGLVWCDDTATGTSAKCTWLPAQ